MLVVLTRLCIPLLQIRTPSHTRIFGPRVPQKLHDVEWLAKGIPHAAPTTIVDVNSEALDLRLLHCVGTPGSTSELIVPGTTSAKGDGKVVVAGR